MKKITSEHRLTLERPPCCLEFLPIRPDCFVVGTYRLLSNDESLQNTHLDPGWGENTTGQLREGSLELFQLVNSEIQFVSSIITPFGILDLHFRPQDAAYLCTATSSGSIAIFKFVCSELTIPPIWDHLVTIPIFEPSTVVTSLAWHPGNHLQLCVTASTGQVALIFPSPALDSAESTSIHALESHSLEAWFAAYLPLTWANDGVVLTGGDDGTLQFHPFPTEPQGQLPATPWKNSKIHGAGVTCILPLQFQTDILLTGSYDDRLRVLQVPSSSSYASSINRQKGPQVLQEANLGGGVWRMRIVAEVSKEREKETLKIGKVVYRVRLVVCCMYASACVVDVIKTQGGSLGNDEVFEWKIQVLGWFKEHESMCYGADLARVTLQDREATEANEFEGVEEMNVVSCSFYDKRLCLWRL